MYDYPIYRTVEEGHTPACWTKAITTALENERDALMEQEASGDYAGSAEHHFRVWLQENGPLSWAEHLLATGSTVCLCPPISKTDLFGPNGQLSHFGRD